MRAGGLLSSVAVVVSAVLAATLLSPVDSAEARVAPVGVPAPVASPPVVPSTSTFPSGDFSELTTADVAEQPVRNRSVVLPKLAQASTFDPEASEVVSRTEFSTVYRNADGSNSTVFSEVPINARDERGQWVPVSTTLSRDGERWAAQTHPLDPSFGPTADAAGAFSVERDGYEIGFTLDDAASSPFSRTTLPRQVLPTQVVYRDVFDGVDLRYDVVTGAVKESLILDEVPARADASWVWRIDTDGLDLVRDTGGQSRGAVPERW